MRQALSLQGDRSRLSIEGALTGAALALTLAFLVQRPVEALPLGADGEEGRGEALEGGPNHRQSWSGTPGRSEDPPAEASGSRGAGIVPSASAAVGAGLVASRASGIGPGAAAAVRAEQTLAGSLTSAGPRPAEPTDAIAADRPPPMTQGAQSDRMITPQPSDAVAPASTLPGDPLTAEASRVPPDEPVQRLRIGIDHHELVVARSVEGPALAVLSSTQVGLEATRLDLTTARRPVVEVESLRRLEGLALSVLDAAELRHYGHNLAVSGSAIEGGSSDGTYRIQARDALEFGVRGGSTGLVDVNDRVVGLQASRFSDAGGQDSLSIGAELALTLAMASAGEPLGGKLSLSSSAVDHTTIQLGDGDDAVRIASRVSTVTAPAPFPDAQPLPNLDLLQVNSRAVGMGSSLLSTGGGDDTVLIEALGGEAVALEDSTIRLGSGDDRLELRGDLMRSRIEPGSGINTVVVVGAVDGATVVLDPAGSASVSLADSADTMVVEGVGGLTFQAAGGDDRITIAGRPHGWLDGGAGRDALSLAPAPEPPALPLPPVQLALQGVNRGQLNDLAFQNVESIALDATDSQVLIAPGAALDGPLMGGGGSGDGLDYGTWSSGVQVDLESGSATAIGKGLPAGIGGFEGVRGGQGDDHLVAGVDTLWMDGGPGVDWLEFNPTATRLGGAPLSLRGGGGSDLFVLAGLDPLLLAPDALPGPAGGLGIQPPAGRPLPSLADLLLTTGPQGQLELSDRLAWRQGGLLTGIQAAALPQVLSPCGLEGLGQARMLPIAPLEALLAGIGSAPPQLAIATGSAASELVLVGGGRLGSLGLAELPAIQFPVPTPAVATSLPAG